MENGRVPGGAVLLTTGSAASIWFALVAGLGLFGPVAGLIVPLRLGLAAGAGLIGAALFVAALHLYGVAMDACLRARLAPERTRARTRRRRV